MEKFSDKKIVDSWKKNASPWVAAVREEAIESRVLVTNDAIVEAILRQNPGTVLDVGCGEGWLIRALSQTGVKGYGVDVVAELIESARAAGGEQFEVLSYEDLAQGRLKEKFDAIVCNFSLIGKESVEQLFSTMPSLLNTGGAFIIQTLHPIAGCGDEKYADGWRAGSWIGFSDQFSDPAPWYFRTIESWTALFETAGFELTILEPVNPKTKVPASIIFIGKQKT